MKLSICEAEIINSFGYFFHKLKTVGFFKIQISKIFWIENLRKLVFRHIKLKLLTKCFNFMLITPLYVNYNLIYECFHNCMFAKNYAVSEKLQHIQFWKFAVFHTSHGTSSLPSINKIRVVMVFSLVHLTWNDPHALYTQYPYCPSLTVF
jgi:hypothetical protein